jgi:hypothetical protein
VIEWEASTNEVISGGSSITATARLTRKVQSLIKRWWIGAASLEREGLYDHIRPEKAC